MGAVSSWWAQLNAPIGQITGQHVFVALVFVLPGIIAGLRFFLFPYASYKLSNFHGKFEFPRPGIGGKAIEAKIEGGFVQRPDLGSGKATVGMTIERDKFQPGNEGEFIYALVDLGESGSVLTLDTTDLRDEYSLTFEGWPLLRHKDYYLTLEREQSVEKARKQLRPWKNEITSLKRSLSHALSGIFLGWGIGCLLIEYVGEAEGWLSLIILLPVTYYVIPKVAWWLDERRNPYWTKDPETFDYVISKMPDPEQLVQGVTIYHVPISRSIIEAPLSPAESLLKGVPLKKSVQLPHVDSQDMSLEDRQHPDVAPRVLDQARRYARAVIERPLLSSEDLAAVLKVYLKAYKCEAIKVKQKQKRCEVTAQMKSKKLSHSGKLKVTMTESESDLTIDVEWAMKYRDGGSDDVPLPMKSFEGSKREDELFWEARKEFDELREVLRPGVLERIVRIIDWSRPVWVGEVFDRIATDIHIWAALGVVQAKDVEVSGVSADQEAKVAVTEEEKKDALESLVDMFAPMSVSERVEALVKLDLVAPGAIATAEIMTIHDIEDFMAERQGISHLIVGGEPVTSDGRLVTKRNDLGSPMRAAASYMGYSALLTTIRFLRHKLAVLEEARKSSRRKSMEREISQVEQETKFERDVVQKLDTVMPTARRMMFDMLGADTAEDVRFSAPESASRSDETRHSFRVKMPLTDQIAKSLRKKIPGIREMVVPGAVLAVIIEDAPSTIRSVPPEEVK